MQLEKNKNKIKEAWLIVLENLVALKNISIEVGMDFKELPESLILAQKVDNQFEYFKKNFEVPNKVVSSEEFKVKKKERDEYFKNLYKVFDELKIDEIIKYLKAALYDRLAQYKLLISGLNVRKDIVKMLELRDEIKLLFDEYEIWNGKWGTDEQVKEREHKEALWQEIDKYDKMWKDYVVVHKKDLIFLAEEAENHLIMKPDGSVRYDFWWWHV